MKASSQAIAAPDPTLPIFVLGAAIALLWAFGAGYLSLALGLLVTVPVLVYCLSRRVEFALGAMVASTAASHFYVEVFGLKAHPEHIAIGLLCCTMPLLLKQGESQYTIRWIAADYLLIAYVGLNIFTSLATSPAPGLTIRWAMQQAIVILPYFLLRVLIVNEHIFRRVFNIMLAVGVVQAAYAIVCFYSSALFHTEFGMDPGQYGTIPGTYGMQLEANILGSYSTASLIMLLWMYLKKPSRMLLAGVAITYAAAAVSLSRAAVAGGCLALVVLLYAGWKTRAIAKRPLMAIARTVVAVSLALAPVLVSFYVHRFGTLNSADIASGEESLGGRLIMGALAYQDILQHPILGTGVSSFQLTFDWSQIDPDTVGGWIDNSELRITHDTGLVGLAVFCSFLGFLIVACRRVLKNELHPELLALAIASLVYAVSFQTTEGTLMAFTWVHIGLIACGISLYARDRLTGEAAEASVN